MTNKTKSQLEAELKTAQTKITQLEGALKELEQKVASQVAIDAKLAESESRFATIFENSPVAIGISNLSDGKITDVNAAFIDLYGHSREGIIGRTTVDLGIWANLADHQHFIEELKTGDHVRNLEVDIRLHSGSERHAIVSGAKVDINGKPSLVAQILDITERKLAEKDLHESRELFQRLFNLSPVAYSLSRVADNKIVDVNPACERLFGYSRDQVVGRRVSDIDFWMDQNEFAKAAEIFWRTGELRDYEFAYKTQSGTVGWAISYANLVEQGGEQYILSEFVDITARKHVEADLRQSRENFARAFTSNPAALAITERDTGKFITTNEAYTKIMGYEQAEVIGRTVAELNIYINPNERPNMLKQIDREGRLRNYELWVRSKSGDRRGLMVSMEPIYYDGNLCILSTFLDITERKLMENQLNESERSYRELVQNANSAIIRWKTNGEIAFFNEYAQTFFGYTAEEAVGKPVSLLLPEIDSSGLDLSRLVESIAENPAQFEKVINENICHDGRRVWMAWTNKPVYDANGSLTEILAVGIDITERKRAEDELRSSQKLLRDIIDNTSALVYILDRDGRFLLINRQLEKIFGLTTHQIFGRTRADFVSADLAKQHRENDLEIFNSGQGNIFEEENMQPDGRHVYLTTKFPLFNPNGDIYAICGISTDMTLRKQMEEELRRSNEELEQFAYIASHDLQEPLRAVAGMVQLLQKRYRGQLDERADEYIAHAVEAAGRMQALIQALLAYSRVDRHNQSIEQVDAQDCLKGALKNLDFAISESHAIITAGPLPRVDADPVQLTQLFQNLIGNGIKFRGDAEPQILISAIQLKDAWQFSVQDNGVGIEPQYFERIFLIFQRLHTRREYDGTGIGLAMCKKIVERHGGRIWVQSEPRRGSTFHFTLPMRSH